MNHHQRSRTTFVFLHLSRRPTSEEIADTVYELSEQLKERGLSIGAVGSPIDTGHDPIRTIPVVAIPIEDALIDHEEARDRAALKVKGEIL